jgi:uncharacterized protein
MIIYENTLLGFKQHVDTNQIGDLVQVKFLELLGHGKQDSERRSWDNSLHFMAAATRLAGLNDDCGVLIEYMIPSTSNRIDFIISGEDDKGNKNFVIVELKQWETAQKTELDGIVETYVGKGMRNTTHPSYQANSYKTHLSDLSEGVSNGNLSAIACAYLHNYKEKSPEPLLDVVYQDIIKDAPLFFKEDPIKLANFLKKYVGVGKGMDILYHLKNGKIKPSKKLIEHITGIFNGNKEFTLLDEQKVAFEQSLFIAKKAYKKSVVIIKGGPGTGKSVISTNLLSSLLQLEKNACFVAPNSSFRTVLVSKLAQTQPKTRLNNLFKSSAGFVNSASNDYDVIIIDEAHRLKKKGAYQYKGVNQVEDMVNAAQVSIFFVDDYQSIRPDDVGSVSEIQRVAKEFNAEVYELELTAQFRCAGAEGYLNWLDNTLQIKETANFDGWEYEDFEFEVFDDPNQLRNKVFEKNKLGLDARILAGYAWKWSGTGEGNSDSQITDIEIPEFDFKMPWNSRKTGTTWKIEPNGLHQVGCIHTSQGLEFDYVGVIIGNDLKFDPVTGSYSSSWADYKDATGKKGLKENPEQMISYIKNIYKVLMSRGMKGCYIYCVDPNVAQFMRSRLERNKNNQL